MPARPEERPTRDFGALQVLVDRLASFFPSVADGLLLWRQGRFGAPTSWAALQDVAVMQQAVKHRTDSGAIAEYFAPILHWTIRSQQCARAFVAAHDDFE